ncbi:MAG: VOC family protein [Saprospiraceae bacterium]|nr:VOC family protein [Saprospiraceae bacterium]
MTVPSLDLTRAVAFYQKLGLILIVDSIPRYARFACPHGTATFSIHQVEQLPSGDGAHIYFECEDLDAHVAELVGQGIVFDELPADKRWLWREARLRDPDGNQLILFYAGENRLDPPWRIRPEHTLL